jgi:bifunctional non-homologous end joining protein LigD
MALKEYNRKRSFEKTPEPKGTSKKTEGKWPHFVVQKHHARNLHYDFRLELDGVLKSWAVPKGPSLNPKDKRLAMMVEDHPISYMTFEGTIPKGNYGAGEVIVWDYGLYSYPEIANPKESISLLRKGLQKGNLKFVLYGEKLRGGFALVKMKDKDNAWLLIKEKDEFVKDTDVRDDETSVKSKISKTPPKVKASMPHNIKPMLATLSKEPFDDPNWIYEIKWDGYRAITEIEKGKTKLYSRNGLDFKETYTEIAEALKSLDDHDCVLDGEIVALKNGSPDFHSLQQYREKKTPIAYILFDLLYLDGEDMREKPLLYRKEKLSELLAKASNPLLLFSEHIGEKGKKFFEQAKEKNMEGIMAKDSQSIYLEGIRSTSWLKIKNMQIQEAIIIGFTKPRGSRKHMGALVLGAYIGKELSYIGHSGGGFTEKELEELTGKLKKIEVEKSPVEEKVPINSPITWVKPKYVCQMKFSEWTKDGRMRHPIYAGLRIDKKPEEVTREKVEIKKEDNRPEITLLPKEDQKEEVKLTNLDKIFWPKEGYTKGDVVDYYNRIADIILPYQMNRPQNLLRHPNGTTDNGFFQKDITFKIPPFGKVERIWSESNNAYIKYLVCQNKETLLYMANLGCIEINPWNSRIGNLDKPDYMIIDLDPGKNSFDDLIIVAKEVHKLLDIACEKHFLKTSGKKGLHICVPLGGLYTYDQIKTFAELLAKIIQGKLPKLTSVERNPEKREGKIYIDYLQNRKGQTLASVYSLRPWPEATISTPIEWQELKKGFDPKDFNIKTIWKRLEKKGDLWKGILEEGIDLKKSIKCLEDSL